MHDADEALQARTNMRFILFLFERGATDLKEQNVSD